MRFPTELRKMWTGREVQQWIDNNFPDLGWTAVTYRHPSKSDADQFGNVIGWDSIHQQEVLINVYDFVDRKGLTAWRHTGIYPMDVPKVGKL